MVKRTGGRRGGRPTSRKRLTDKRIEELWDDSNAQLGISYASFRRLIKKVVKEYSKD